MTEPTDSLVVELAHKLVETLGLDTTVDLVDPAAPLIGAGLGIDSIDTLELVIMIEKDYGVKIDTRWTLYARSLGGDGGRWRSGRRAGLRASAKAAPWPPKDF